MLVKYTKGRQVFFKCFVAQTISFYFLLSTQEDHISQSSLSWDHMIEFWTGECRQKSCLPLPDTS